MQSVFLNRDLLTGCILPRLSIFDVFSFFLTNTAIWQKYKNCFGLQKGQSATLHLFNKRLLDGLVVFYGASNAHVIMKKIQSGSVYLTGGFLLAAINADSLHLCQDVDLMVVMHVNHGVFDHDEFKQERSALKTQIMCGLENAISSNDVGAEQFYENGYAVDTLLLNGKKLQFIFLQHIFDETKGEHQEENVVAIHCCRFDFQYCSNYFANNKLVCCFPKAVKERSCGIKIDRNIRYATLVDQQMVEFMNRIWSRVQKYRAKGYHLDVASLYGAPVKNILRAQWDAFWKDKI